MNIALVTVIYKRPELTEFVLSYYKEQKERLKNKINIELICVGSEGDVSRNLATKNGFEYHEFPNTPVSNKHNKVVEVCKNKNIDGVVYVGSDDIIDDIFYDEYIKCIQNEIDFLGFTDVYFLTEDHLGYWGGYKSNTPRYNEPIGPGKFYSKKLLGKLNWRPWGDTPLNRGLDGSCWKILNQISDIKKIVKKCTDISGHIIDIKTETNITNINDIKYDYEFGLDYIYNLNFGYDKIKVILKKLKAISYDLSIIISTYKNVNFITETLDSIYKSIGGYNVEILVGIDNCEETLNFVQNNKFQKNTSFLYFEKNLGPYVVFNSLVEIAKSENILFFGSDDIMNSHMIENVVIGLKTSALFKTKYRNFKKSISEVYPELHAKGVFGIKKSVFLHYNGFEPWRVAADSEFLKRLTNNNIKTTNSNELDFYRRVHPDSLTNRPETGFKSEKRKEYQRLMDEKTYFGPLEKLNTHAFKSVNSKGFLYFKKNLNIYDLSIIISTFDNVEYLKSCFDSITNNKTDYKYEVLIGIDGCDKTLNYVNKNIFPDNFRFYYFKENQGPYIVFNTLTNLSSSNKLLFFGSDDIMSKNLISNVMLNLEKNDCFRCSYVDFKDGEKINEKKTRSVEGGVFGIKFDVFEKLGGFRPWRCEGDSEFILRLIQNGFNLKTSSQIDFYRRVHNKGLTSRKDTGYSSKLRMEYKSQYVNKKHNPPLVEKKVANYNVIKEGEFFNKNKIEPVVKNSDILGGIFNRQNSSNVKEVDYKKINEITQNRELQKEKTHSKPERPINENSNANTAKRAAITKKPVKPVNSSPNSKIGKDFLRI